MTNPGNTEGLTSQARLEKLHSRLAEHFAGLHEQRLSLGNWPLFALEHGLSSSEIYVLKADIHEQLLRNTAFGTTWLPWIVYAAEIGYVYSGREYWQTFEEQTPGWGNFGLKAREWLRDWYQKFERELGGF